MAELSDGQKTEVIRLYTALIATGGPFDQATERLMAITNDAAREVHNGRLQAIRATALNYKSRALSGDTGAASASVFYEEAVRYLDEIAPAGIANTRELIEKDIADPSGKAALAVSEARIAAEAKVAESKLWLTDPEAYAKAELKKVGEAVTELQLASLKKFWPILAIGGAIAALVYFGPALGVLAKRGARRV